MSESAFGVEHGDFSKAVPWGRKRREEAARLQRVKQERMARNNAARKKAVAAPKNAATKVANKKVSIADTGRAAGKPLVGLANITTKHPGAAGALVIGGGGYGAYRLARKEPKKEQ